MKKPKIAALTPPPPVLKRRGPKKRGTPADIQAILDGAVAGGHEIPGPIDPAQQERWRKNLRNHGARQGLEISVKATAAEGLWVTLRQARASA